ncbi:MAG: hypothetical protein RR334_01025 [Clostridia bacterium]
MEETKLKNTSRNNYIKALGYSALTAFIGSIIWGLLYSINFFTGLVIILTAESCVFVYRKFKRNINWLTYVWNIFVMIVFTFLSLYLTLGIIYSINSHVLLIDGLKYIINAVNNDANLSFAINNDIRIISLLTVASVVGVCLYYNYKDKKDHGARIIEEAIIKQRLEDEDELNKFTKENNQSSTDIKEGDTIIINEEDIIVGEKEENKEDKE